MEKRDSDRLLKRLIIRFGIEKPNSLGITVDISETGIFIKSNTVFPPGTSLQIELTLPNDQTVSLEGHVMWAKRVPPNMIRLVKKSGMGVRLIGVPPGYHEVLAEMAK